MPSVGKAPRSRLRRWGRRFGLTFLAFLVLLAAGHAWWGLRAAARLESRLAPARAAGDPLTVEELNRWPAARGGAGENVVPALRHAAGLVDSQSDAWREGTDVLIEAAVPLTDDEGAALESIVRSNAEALRAMDAAAGKGAVDWGLNFQSPMINHQYPKTDLAGTRDLTRLLRADALLAHRRGDHARALRRAEQILTISRAVDYQPGMIPHLVAVGIGATATVVVADVVPEMSAGDAGAPPAGAADPERVKALIRQLLDDRPLREGWRRGLVGERVMQLDTVTAVLEGRMSVAGISGQERSPPMGPLARYVSRPYMLDNAAAMAGFTGGAIEALDASADLHAFRRAVPPRAPEVEASLKRYMLAAIMMPSLNRVAEVHHRCVAEQRLAATCLAVRLYEADHDGKAPQTLDDLVPAYLPAVPPDPFVEGGAPLRYVGPHADPQRPRVYSVGINGADDGGRPPDPDAPRQLDEATSDLVYFLKRQPRVFPETLPWEDEPGDGPPAEPDEQHDEAAHEPAH